MKWAFLFILSFVCQATLANVNVQATVDRNEMGLGDTLTLSVSVQSSEAVEVSEPRIPSLSGFSLVNNWTSSSSSSKLVQGQGGMQFETVRRQDFNYMLTPQRQGTITIPGFEVVVDGKAYNTKPIAIRVSGQGSGATQTPPGLPNMEDIDEAEEMFNQLLQRRGLTPPAARNLPKNPNEAFFIQAEVDKTDVYEGEQILVSWYIYTRGNLMSLDRLKFPDLKGFWKEIIEEVPALNFTQEVINGIPYRRALLASHALFPIKPGVAVIDEYKIKAQVQLPTNPFGAFGFGKPYSYQKSSERIKVNVKPLPVDGKPNSFSGAVGQFDVRALIEGNQFPVNQPFSLRVRFEGSGNAKLIELPHLELPAGLEIYDTKSDAKFFKNGRSYKEFEVLLIPRQEGELTIPPLNFSLFDPAQKKYVTKTTEALPLKIIANPNGNAAPSQPGSALNPAGSAAPTAEKKKELPDILASWDRDSSMMDQQVQGMLWGAVYLFIFAVLAWKARREFGWGQKQRDLKQELQKRSKKIHALIDQGKWREAGTEMTNSIYHILGQVSGLGGASQELSKLLDQAPPSLRRELGSELSNLVDFCQVLSFAPEAVVGRLKEKSELKKNAEALEKTLLKALKLAENKTSEDIP
ncbi:MAG: BatD family protein [Pseudobdellovibrionaceae bacterium]